MGPMPIVQAGVLDIAFHELGPAAAPPVVLLHGFPYDPHTFDAVAPRLAAAGLRCLMPFLRGFGPTRFRSSATPRSGQQAALGADLLAFLDALAIPSALLAGYDWGGRAASIVAALFPERVRGLVSGDTGYNIQDLAAADTPLAPERERRLWYQFYLHSERGRAGLAANRDDFARLLWRLWSPTWQFSNDLFAQTAPSLYNPDFVDVVVHSYRHRFGLVPGDPALELLELRLAAQPSIPVPTVVLQGLENGVHPTDPAHDAAAPHFTGPYRRELLPDVGHNLPQEAPEAFASAVLSLSKACPNPSSPPCSCGHPPRHSNACLFG